MPGSTAVQQDEKRYEKMLVAFDGSDGSRIALAHAAALAKKLGSSLTALWVQSTLAPYPETIDEVAREARFAQRFFLDLKSQVRILAAGQGLEIPLEMRAGHPAKQIVEYARERRIDLIVVGNRGHSRFAGELLGHTADRVNENAPCSVLIVRSGAGPAAYRKMLVGYDGSAGSDTALKQALELAGAVRSKVSILWVHSHPVSENRVEADHHEEWAWKFFSSVLNGRIQSAADRAELKVDTAYRRGDPAKTIVEEASTGGFELIVLGQSGYSGLWGRLLGGVADRVSHRARCDVLVVREKQANR